MPGVEQRFDGLFAATRPHVAVMEASLVVDRRVFVGIELEATRLAAERLLFRTIGTGHKMAARTFLGRVSRPPRVDCLPALFGAPGELPGEVGQITGVQIGIGTAGLEPHRAYITGFVGDLVVKMIGIELVDREVDLLSDVTSQALIGQRWQARDALLLETRAQPGFAPPFLAVLLVAPGELPMERAVAFACAGRQEV